MANLTIRNIDASVTTRLRLRAAQHGRSMEDEARQILQQAVLPPTSGPEGLGSRIHRRFAALGGIELDIPHRKPSRQPPDTLESDGA